MKYFIYVTVFLLLITGCEERQNKESFKDKQLINVSSDKLDDTLHNPSFIEDVWTVKLEDLFVHFPFKNVIYQFVENEFKPVYEINIDDRHTPKEVFNLKDYEVFKNEYFESTKYYHMWTCVKVSNNYFIMPIFNNKKVIGNIWIDRRSNEYFSAKQVTVNNDGINMTLPLLPRAVKGDTVIALNGFINSYFTAGPEEQDHSYYYENPTLTFYKLK